MSYKDFVHGRHGAVMGLMAFTMTGIVPAAAMVIWLAAFIARFTKARQPLSFTPAWPAWAVMAGMGCYGLKDDRNHPGRSNGDLVGIIHCEVPP